MPALQILAPGLFEAPQPAEPCRFPALDMLLSRSDHLQRGEVGFEALLCSLFDLHAETGRDLPTASLMLLAEGGDPRQHCWAAVAPAHLHVDRDRLLLAPVDPAALRSEEIARLRDAFNRHFHEDGVELLTDRPRNWYLRLRRPRELLTSPLADVAGRTLDPFLPRGQDAAWLRGLMNEAQMLLHELAIANLNSLWFWGSGRLPAAVSCRFGQISGDNLLLRGLQAHAVPPCSGSDRLVLLDGPLLAVQRGDQQLWRRAMQQLQETVAAGLAALSRGEVDSITLQDGSGASFYFRHWMRYRWWRRPYGYESMRPAALLQP
jgi:hypothetical protein